MSWLISKALMNSLSLQEQVEEYLGDTSLVGEQSVQSSGSSTPQAYCAPDKMTGFSRLSRFGMTYKPLKENLGEELLTLYLAGFHAKTSQPQEKELASKESEAQCGEKWRGSFTKYDLDSRLWKTHQCSLLGGLEPYSEIWPRWGLMRDGECWEQQTLELTIRGIGSGLSPNGVDSFHTPNTTGLDGGSNSRKALRKKMNQWPTPVTRDYKDTGTKEAMTRQMNKRQSPGLALVIGAEIGGKLNPTWTEWLMGWPLEWTELKPLETDKFRQWQQQHGIYCQESEAA